MALVDEDSKIWIQYPYYKILKLFGDKELAVHSVRLAYIVIDSANYGIVNLNSKVQSYIAYAKNYYGISLEYNKLLEALIIALKYMSNISIYEVSGTYFIVPENKKKKFLRKYPEAKVII